MKRRPWIGIATIVAAGAWAEASAGATGISNGSLEQGSGAAPAAWQSVAEAGAPVFVWEEAGHAGQRSVSIATQSETDVGYWEQTMPVLSNRFYTARVWYRTDKIASELPANFQLRATQMAGALIASATLALKGKPAPDWTEVTGEAEAPADAISAVVELVAEGASGHVWFDQIYLAP